MVAPAPYCCARHSKHEIVMQLPIVSVGMPFFCHKVSVSVSMFADGGLDGIKDSKSAH